VRQFTAVALIVLFARFAVAQENDAADETQPQLSPDKKWECRLVDAQAAIVRAGTSEVVVELAGMNLKLGTIVWAPDSRRFAYSFQSGGRYFSCSVYELTGSVWKELPDFEEKASAVTAAIAASEQRQRKRLGVARGAYRRRINDTWRVRRWIDNNTLEGFAFSEGTVVVNKETEDLESLSTGIVFKARCDNRGGWKLIALRECSAREAAKILSEDESD
jgi:hypothetical protein